MFTETPHEYAQRRANETRRAYIVSDMGHAMLDVVNNRQVFKDCELTIVARYRPARAK